MDFVYKKKKITYHRILYHAPQDEMYFLRLRIYQPHYDINSVLLRTQQNTKQHTFFSCHLPPLRRTSGSFAPTHKVCSVHTAQNQNRLLKTPPSKHCPPLIRQTLPAYHEALYNTDKKRDPFPV